MKKGLLIGLFLAMMLVFGATPPYASAQGDDLVLYGIIGKHLVTVNHVTGDATGVAMLSGDSVDSVGPIAFDPTTGVLYGLARAGGTRVPRLVTIDICTGEVGIIGPITLTDNTVYFAEGLAINPAGIIYVSMSTDNIISPDYYSETLATVNPENAVATWVATITITGITNGEADGLEFVGDNTLYAIDDPGLGPSRVYTINTSTGAATLKGTLQSPSPQFNNVGDMAYNPDSKKLYGCDLGAVGSTGGHPRHLCTISQPGSATATDIGVTYTPSEFGGGFMYGLAWAGPCKPFIYSVKFLCGRGSESFGVEPADYATAINIHNFHDETVVLKKKVVVAHREGEAVGTVSRYTELLLGPNEAVEVDCVDICSLLRIPFPRSTFIKGFVVIESYQPLNIVAVYTSSEGGGFSIWMSEGRGFSMDIEYISPVASP